MSQPTATKVLLAPAIGIGGASQIVFWNSESFTIAQMFLEILSYPQGIPGGTGVGSLGSLTITSGGVNPQQIPYFNAVLPDASFQDVHNNHHGLISDALVNYNGTQAKRYALTPIPPDGPTLPWLQTHQAAHNQANQALGLQSGSLLALDMTNQASVQSWNMINTAEHQNIVKALAGG